MRTMCARVVMLAAVLSGAVPIAARTEPDEKIDSNIADWVETCKLRFLVRAVIEHTDGLKLQVDVVGPDLTALIDTRQVVG